MDVLVYGDINDYSAGAFIQSIDENEDEQLVVRVNTNGGDPQAAYGMAAKMRESENYLVKADGKVYSSGLFFIAFAKKGSVEGLSQTRFLVHRARYNEWLESSDSFVGAIKDNLIAINKDLRKAFEAKVDVVKFEKIAGKTLDEIFDIEQRVDVFLTARQAKSIGLIDKIKTMTPEASASLVAKYEVAASGGTVESDTETEQVITSKKSKIMNKEQLKAEHPAVYAEVYGEGVAAGTNTERDRVGAYALFADVDPKAVIAGIKSGENLSQTLFTELSIKRMSATALGGLENESTAAITTAAVDLAEVDKGESTELQTIEAKLQAELIAAGQVTAPKTV